MNELVNRPADVVDDMLEGVAFAAPVRLLRDGRGMRIVVRRDIDPARVALVSGGGAGHEPAHAGYVGEGMLTATVSGELFASPSVDAVLTAIRTVTGAAGCLLIVKSYTGDRLNFGLAAERARSEGLAVATVLVADDVALPDVDRPRGLAGTVLVHKLAGQLAREGHSLESIRARSQAFADSLRSIGLALSPCHVPGRAHETRPPELGMGIHNEPGARRVEVGGAAEAMQLVLDPLLAGVAPEMSLVVMLNDLGGCSPQETLVLLRELCMRLGADRIARLIRPTRLLSSCDMHGFSVSIAPADPQLLHALDAAAPETAWPGTMHVHPVEAVTLAHEDTRTAVQAQDADRVTTLRRICAALVAARAELDALDAKVGDGDAGSTFATGARAIWEQLDAELLPTADLPALFTAIGALLARVMGGSSGVLCSIGCTAMGIALRHGDPVAAALAHGIERMQTYGGARQGDRTMLDALIPAAEALPRDLDAAISAARAGANSTAAMTRAGAGRASYVPEAALLGTADPGAEAVARAFAALRS